MAKRISSMRLNTRVADSSPSTASQFPHLASPYWPRPPSWETMYIAVSLIKELEGKRKASFCLHRSYVKAPCIDQMIEKLHVRLHMRGPQLGFVDETNVKLVDHSRVLNY